VVSSLSWRSCSKRSAVKLSVRELVSSEVFSNTPRVLRGRRFSRGSFASGVSHVSEALGSYDWSLRTQDLEHNCDLCDFSLFLNSSVTLRLAGARKIC